MDFKIVPFNLKSASVEGSTFSGWANAFCNIDAAQEIVAPGAFKDTLPQFLEFGFVGGINHDWSNPLGKPTKAAEEQQGLFVEGKISPTTYGKDCMILLKDDVIKKMSIGYRVLGDLMLEDAEDVAAWWQENNYTPNAQDIARAAMGCRVLTKLHLYEFSPVTVAANDMADITGVKRYMAEDIPTQRAFERFLRDAGLSRKEAVTTISLLFKSLQRDAEETKGLQRDADEAASQEAQQPPTEPEPPTEQPPDEETIEAKTEPEPTTEVPAPVVVDLSSAVRQAAVQAHFATFTALKAKYGLLGEPDIGKNSIGAVAAPGAKEHGVPGIP